MTLTSLVGCQTPHSRDKEFERRLAAVQQKSLTEQSSPDPSSEQGSSGDESGPWLGPVDNNFDFSTDGDVAVEVDDEQDLSLDAFEEGFCKDDIYATWLKQQWYANNPKNKDPKPDPRLAPRGRKRTLSQAEEREIRAIHYARQRLVGEMVPYFGAIPVVANPMVEHWLRYFKTSGRRAFLKWLVRGESVREVVGPLLKEQGLPPELFFLAMIESGFSNSAYSRARATGTWQFMSGTAKIYGLRIDHFVDERRDPVKSTIAAANFLKDLYIEFGDWYLAMAAYNAGPGKIRRAVRAVGAKDFWKIAETRHIAKETRHYVPKMLAALIMASNPKAHGFDVKPNPVDMMPRATVKLRTPASLDEIASKLGLPPRVVQWWNPELIRNVTPPRARDGYALRLPESLLPRFAAIESELSTVEVKEVQMHKIRPGETLARIARRYQVNVKQILSVNPTLKPNRLKVGSEIAVPVPAVVTRPKAQREV